MKKSIWLFLNIRERTLSQFSRVKLTIFVNIFRRTTITLGLQGTVAAYKEKKLPISEICGKIGGSRKVVSNFLQKNSQYG